MTWWPPRTLVPAGASLSQLFLIHFTLWWATSSLFIFFPPWRKWSVILQQKECERRKKTRAPAGAFRVRSDSVSKKITHGVRCLVISDATIPFFKKKTCCCCRLSLQNIPQLVLSHYGGWKARQDQASSTLLTFLLFSSGICCCLQHPT